MDNTSRPSEVRFDRDKPMEFSLQEDTFAELTEFQQHTLDAVRSTLQAYVNSAEKLLTGPYAHVRQFVPSHILNPGNILITCCPDGIATRFENRTDESQIIAAWSDESLVRLVPMLSQNVIRCYSDRHAI